MTQKTLAVFCLLYLLASCGGSNESQAPTNVGETTSSSASSSSSGTSSSSSSSSTSASSSSGSTERPPEAGPISATFDESVVRFVYFLEKDQEFNAARYAAIREQAFAMQTYWYEQFGGTFYLYGDIVDVIYGDRDADWYVETEDNIHNLQRWYRLGNISEEIFRKLGLRAFDPKVRIVSYPSARFDGRVGANFGGAWMDGDDSLCLLGENSGHNFPFPDLFPAQCMGHVAHELGHVFGLGHTGPRSDCMQLGFYIGESTSNPCIFSQANRNTVKSLSSNTRFLEATPGLSINHQGLIVSE